jgi:Protein of unknown function (DUF3455)
MASQKRMNALLVIGAVVSTGAFALGCAGGRASTSSPGGARSLPPDLALPAGEVSAFKLRARGSQNYECRESRDSPGEWQWVFVAPEAELLDGAGRPVGKHYAGPTWESAADGSKVVGKVKARADAPDPKAIPWLLLQAVEVNGSGMFASVKSVQRLDTTGGQAPAGGCDASAAGRVAKVPYTAAYVFSRAAF